MTALIAIFSTLAGAFSGAISPTTCPASKPLASIIAATRSSVGGTTGSPSVMRRWRR